MRTIDCCVDADWAGDNVDRESTSGYVLKVFRNVIDWKSRKQRTVTKASTYASHIRRFTSTAPAHGVRTPNPAISNSCL